MTDTQWLTDIYGVGTKTVENISQFFQNTNNLTVLKELESAGLNMDPQKYSDTISKDEAKGSFSITGTFPLSREKIAELLQAEGYLFHESPTKSTDCMLVGDKAGSKKDKALEYGIQIIEGREAIQQKFPFLANREEKKAPQVQSLFG
jgi:DNA ligase (NAD+)